MPTWIPGPATRQIAAKVLGGMLVLSVALTVTLALVLPRVTGGAALTVLSGSMTPTLPVGSAVIVRPVSAADVVAGDIITYANPSGSFTTHRVEEVQLSDEGRLFVTKGDANEKRDSDPVHESSLRGRVWFHVPFIGYAREAVGSPAGLATIGVLMLLILITDWFRSRSAASARDSDHPDDRADEQTGSPVGTVPAAGMPIPHGQSDGLAQLMMARIHLPTGWRSEILQVCTQVGGTVIASGPSAIVLTFSGTPTRLDEIETYLTTQTAVTVQRTPVLSTFLGDQLSRRGNDDNPPAGPHTEDQNLRVAAPTSKNHSPTRGDSIKDNTHLTPPPPVAVSLALVTASSNGHSREELPR